MHLYDEGFQKIPLLAVIPKTFVKDTKVPVKDGMGIVFQAFRLDGNIGAPLGFSVNLAADQAVFFGAEGCLRKNRSARGTNPDRELTKFRQNGAQAGFPSQFSDLLSRHFQAHSNGIKHQ